ncbi:DUF2946 family protein [Pontibaca methylaminivorans]|uniref:DUF2946 domain-containing protein n=1 Tax=Pontibaca methylaminivorans TaxID=515897 RepID=A0A1R3X8K5_9RHOB|nr:DUF2946 family protein [Pontibaca methylaminivorans]SIT86600.1 hypothetical protein SAMN05421849_2338 [Pontibaca methylaminivorans]
MAARRSPRSRPPRHWWRTGRGVAVLFIFSLLFNSLAVTAGAAVARGGGTGAGLVIELCTNGQVEQVVIRDGVPAPAPAHDCADWRCMLCVSVLPSVDTGEAAARVPAPRATRLVLPPVPDLPAWRVQGRSANPRAPPA